MSVVVAPENRAPFPIRGWGSVRCALHLRMWRVDAEKTVLIIVMLPPAGTRTGSSERELFVAHLFLLNTCLFE